MEKARQLQCLNQVKQLHLYSYNYSGDYSGFSPPNTPRSGTFSYSLYWHQLFVTLGYVKVPPSCIGSNGELAGAPGSIFRCPSEKRKEIGGTNEWNVWKGCHYGQSAYLHWTVGSEDDARIWTRFTRVPKASQVAFLGDKEANSTETFGYALPDKFRHSNGMNVFFADGHGEYRKLISVPFLPSDLTPYKRTFWGRKDCYGVYGGW